MQRYMESAPPSTGDPQVEAPPAPFNLDIEQAVLGALLISNDALDDVAFLGFEHFFDPLHQSIYTAICRTVKAGRRANPVTLSGDFADAPPVDATTTVLQYLGTLGGAAATRRQLPDYAQTIVDLAVRRWLILAAEDLAEDARNASLNINPKTLIEETEQRLFALAERNAPETSTLLTFGQAATQAVDSVGKAYKNEYSGIRTGLADLDKKIGGLQPTDLIVLAGRPSMGKTALATNIAFHIARHGKTPVGFFSLEMSAEQLALRVLSERIEVASNKLRSGNVSEQQIKTLMQEAENLAEVPLFTDEIGGATIAQVVSRARRLKRRHNVGLIVIDYLQLMQASRRRENRVQDITEITTGLKALAKELRVPILALSQLSRETEKRENKRPQLSDLRESGSIEQDADVVLFVFREEYYLERQAPSMDDKEAMRAYQAKLANAAGKAEIIISKQRHGETGSVRMAFSGEFTRFSNLAQEALHGL
jgi:replicative DNA helicase